MKKLSKAALIGYPAGIVTGITYGLNPLFAMPLMNDGAAITSILFFRYAFAVLMLGLFLLLSRQSFKLTLKQAGVLLLLGLLYASSSLFLFESYHYIASGLATTLVFLYPVLVAIIMVFLGVVPSWPVWLAIVATFVGVLVMMQGGSADAIHPLGVILSLGSALVYSLYIVIVNKSKIIADVPSNVLTFYALSVGVLVFLLRMLLNDAPFVAGLVEVSDWLNLLGLALFPTVISMASLAVATRNIGATKASVLGVFEPITAILIGTLMFAEPLSLPMLLGIAISILAVTFMIILTKR